MYICKEIWFNSMLKRLEIAFAWLIISILISDLDLLIHYESTRWKHHLTSV